MTLTFALALTLGAVLLVRSVRHTVLRSAVAADKGALDLVGEQIRRGVPFEKLDVPDDAARIIFLRPPGAQGPLPGEGPDDFMMLLPKPWKLPDGVGVGRGKRLFFRHRLPPPDARTHSIVGSIVHPPGGAPIELFAERPLDEVRRSVDTLAQVLWIGIPLLLVLIAVASWIVVGRALSPVDAMTRQVVRIGAANLHERLPEPAARDAIGELARMLNRMLARLEEASRMQRQFTSNASHELRSPVASIRTQVEVALAHPEAADWQAVLRGILAEDRRLEALIADLLLLARLDEEAPPPAQDVDLEDVLLEELRRPRRVPVECSPLEPVRVVGHAAQLGCAVRNLLDNAGRHARSRVNVSLRVEDGVARLAVDDDGPGIPVADRERVFERFTRLEEGRSRDAGGVGLGLALVRRIVERHGGRVDVGDAAIGGASLRVLLPQRFATPGGIPTAA